MLSGRKPASIMARAEGNAKDPMPCPVSKMTPRSRAFRTHSSTLPSARAGELGNGRRQWVSTSPGRSSASTSSITGNGWSRWTITLMPTRSATWRATFSGPIPWSAPA